MIMEIKAKRICYRAYILLQFFVKERYYFKLLFIVIQGFKSFRDLYIVDKILYPMF